MDKNSLFGETNLTRQALGVKAKETKRYGGYGKETLLRACLYEQEALLRVLVRKGLLTNEEVLEEVKAVRLELEKKRGR